jgi:NAD(P)-dependent dehydrogenase (short-subunit alcohol dehydrogenase family)
VNVSDHAVLVTGTSTGIGRATALHLAKRGTIVYAGVRRASDGEKLAADGGANIRPLQVDVTDAISIATAVETIAARGDVRLGALVNNAGAAFAGPLEMLPPSALRAQFDVNFFGPIALAQAVLPLLRETRGRIINVSSIGGKLVTPFVGAYSASKFSLEAASDAMRVELAPWGVRVVLIEPGAVKTPIWQSASDRSLAMLDGVPPALRALYEKPIAALLKLSAQQERDGTTPERVAAAIVRALDAKSPRARYLVGIDARVLRVLSRLPDPARDALFRWMFSRGGEAAVATQQGLEAPAS